MSNLSKEYMLSGMTKYFKHIKDLLDGLGHFIQNGFGAVKTDIQTKMRETVSVEDFGAKGWPNDDTLAIQRALDYAVLNPCRINFKGKVYGISDTLYWKGNAWLIGLEGISSIKLLPGANCTIIESYEYERWAAWVVGDSLDGYPMYGGIDGLILDGNAGQQGVMSTDATNLKYALRVHSHRFGIGWMQIRRVKGAGQYTKYNSAIMYALRTDGKDDYGYQGSPDGSPSPFDFRQINIIDTLYEAFVFAGPADIPIWHLTTNYCGWLDNKTAPTTPRKSILFPGEEIHSVRMQTAGKIGYLNSNGALYGRALYVAPFVRFHGDTIIAAASWGAVLIEGSAFGSISALCVQHNAFSWEGVFKPGLEILPGTSSVAFKNKFSFPQTSLRRVTTPLNPNSIGPLIYDNSGAQFGIIDGVDSNPGRGHGVVLGPMNRGGVYESVNLDSIGGLAADGTVSAAIMIEEGAEDWAINTLRLTNCDRNVVNFGAKSSGIIYNGTINVSATQIALEGIVTSSQLSNVIPGNGSIDPTFIDDWNIDVMVGKTRYRNHFKTVATFDGAIVGRQVAEPVKHMMWRTPTIGDISSTLNWGGITWPNMNAGMQDINETTVTPAAFVHTPSTGKMRVAVKIN